MSDQHFPSVSVITPFLNGGDWLRQAVESVIAQDYQYWQQILIDDGSLPEATKIAKDYSDRYPGKIIYTEHPGHANKGVTASRNLGITKANSQLVAFLDSDDCWLPDKLRKQVNLFSEYPAANVICEASKYWFTWEKPNSQDMMIKVGVEENKLYEPPVLIYKLYPLGKGAAPCPSGMIMKKTVLDKIGGFEESFTGANQVYEDQAFLCKIYLTEKVFVSGEANNLYRQRSGSLMQSINQRKQYLKVRAFFLKWMENYLEQHNIDDARINKLISQAKFEIKNPNLHLFFAKFRSRIQRLMNQPNL